MVTKFVMRSGFDHDTDEASLATALTTGDESVVQDQFADECDINTIVRRFGLTGDLPQNLRMPVSGDFTGIGDFQTAMNVVRQAEEEFMRIPAETRARFSNDPARLMSFLDDASNRDEAIKLGLVNPPSEVDRAGGSSVIPPTS